MDKLIGSVVLKQNISCEIVLKQNISGTIALPFSANQYEGEYEVTPTIDGKVLETANKILLDDVTINPIPYQDVPNPHGSGRTVIIAFE